MISIKSEREIELLRVAGNIVHETREYLIPFIKEGITTKELDTLAEEFILSKGATPSFKGLNDFPCATCISINQEVVHGIPGKRKLRNGDIVSIDIGACYHGYHGDSAWTFAVGEISEGKKKLMEHTKESLFKGLEQIKPGNRIGDISHAIEIHAKKYNLGVVRELVGHGVGGVCPFGVNEDVEVYLDKSLQKLKIVNPASGSSNSAVRLTIKELEEASNYIRWVDICK